MLADDLCASNRATLHGQDDLLASLDALQVRDDGDILLCAHIQLAHEEPLLLLHCPQADDLRNQILFVFGVQVLRILLLLLILILSGDCLGGGRSAFRRSFRLDALAVVAGVVLCGLLRLRIGNCPRIAFRGTALSHWLCLGDLLRVALLVALLLSCALLRCCGARSIVFLLALLVALLVALCGRLRCGLLRRRLRRRSSRLFRCRSGLLGGRGGCRLRLGLRQLHALLLPLLEPLGVDVLRALLRPLLPPPQLLTLDLLLALAQLVQHLVAVAVEALFEAVASSLLDDPELAIELGDEPCIVRDQDEATVELRDCGRKSFNGLDVQVIRRLVQHDDVRLAQHQCGERDARFLPSGKVADLGEMGSTRQSELP
mmetsp:Transcript_24312/g.69315  ORF Transcript_24312/g.69315 Transcript_24312/m.69315 type:complete len:373 (-) Transcript_24312:2477-3595(-)